MFSAVKGFLKRIFGADKTTTIEVPPAEKTGFSIGHEWPFPSPEPPNPEYLVGELIKGIKVEGDHVFFFWGDQKRRHIRTTRGTETVLARNIIWWMEGRKVPITSQGTGLTTNCGEPKCVKLSHLVLKVSNIPHGPTRPQTPAVRVPKAKQPPKPPVAKPGRPTKLENLAKTDRSKCMSRKAYFATKAEADRKKRELNKPENRGRRPRFHVYPCDLLCGGWHLTHIDPKKYAKKKVGAW